MKKVMKRTHLQIDVPKQLHSTFKAKCAELGILIKDSVGWFIKRFNEGVFDNDLRRKS